MITADPTNWAARTVVVGRAGLEPPTWLPAGCYGPYPGQCAAAASGLGTGGLAAGIALMRAGFEVSILERSPAPREIGSGILIQPNGIRALEAIGVPALPGNGLGGIERRTWRGRHLSQTPFGRYRERYGWEVRVVARSDLHSLLIDALGRDRVSAGAEVSGYEVGAGKVTVRLRDGRTLEADLLIGADGLRSAVRAQMLADGEPSYLGCTAWRATTKPSAALSVGQGFNWWGPGGEFGVLPMADSFYWFATANAARGGDDPPGRRIESLLDRFGGWEAPIADLISSTEPDAILRNDIFDRPTTRRWLDGPVALLGDAAHPMTPKAGQGACQALEDAAALGASLAEERAIESGLAAYQRKRLVRAKELVRISRQVSAAGQTESRLLAGIRNLAARLTPERLILSQLDRTLGGSRVD
jgi:2-polyprenyl-6-methoxyphenol hydroxylase-like FAD-dependent oxidoreductase